MKNIYVSEYFYSIQGEGRTAGAPSVFIRLTGCNLMCGGFGTEKDKELRDGATWRCDSIEVWQKGNAYEVEDLIMKMDNEFRFLSLISSGAHIVFTGGEPLLQQDAICRFIQVLRLDYKIKGAFIEVETNGTKRPTDYLLEHVDHWNISPKLSNSGMPSSKRIALDALKDICCLGKAYMLKFVVSDGSDMRDIFGDFLNKMPYVSSKHIYFMPAVDNAKDYAEVSQIVAEICKHNIINFSGRQHITIWDKKTGV